MPKKLKKEMGFTGFDASLLVSSYNLVFADLLLSLLTTCSRLVIIKLERVMQMYPDISLPIV